MRRMSLRGLSHDAWKRYSGNGAWDYRIVAPGYKCNLTDIAAALSRCGVSAKRSRDIIGRRSAIFHRSTSPVCRSGDFLREHKCTTIGADATCRTCGKHGEKYFDL